MLHSQPINGQVTDAIKPARDIRALLLDDDTFDRQRIRRMTSKTNLPIVMDEVSSIQALDKAMNRANYDLILIDYRLPEGDGMEALDLVLQNPMNRDASKIMITGDGSIETAIEAMRAGCHDFLSKSDLSIDLLRHAMLKAMELSHERRQMVMQLDAQRDMIRDGLLAGLTDADVQNALGDLVQKKLMLAIPQNSGFVATMNPSDIEALLSSFEAEDEFIFH